MFPLELTTPGATRRTTVVLPSESCVFSQQTHWDKCFNYRRKQTGCLSRSLSLVLGCSPPLSAGLALSVGLPISKALQLKVATYSCAALPSRCGAAALSKHDRTISRFSSFGNVCTARAARAMLFYCSSQHKRCVAAGSPRVMHHIMLFHSPRTCTRMRYGLFCAIMNGNDCYVRSRVLRYFAANTHAGKVEP